MELNGKTAIVTGGGRGIGEGISRVLAREGANVVVMGRHADEVDGVARSIHESGGSALPLVADVTDWPSLQTMARIVVERFGGIDVLVNNAGANKRGPIERYTPEELAGVVQVNLVAPILLTRLVLPFLRARGRGAIVNVASLAGRIPVGHEAVYSATKFGLRAFTFALQEELEGSGITVSAVSPGPVDTGFIMENLEEVPDLVFAQPMSTAAEVARLILDCAADGVPERVIPQLSGFLATAGYLFPALRRVMVPMMERRGKLAKVEYRQRRAKQS
jgi:NAD(P)-dependent dehydrogenase (short-subunit alcohol dehydrogenase family)